jgi:hypothetical protein
MKHLKLLLVGISAVIGLGAPALASAKDSAQNSEKSSPLATDLVANDLLIALEQSTADRQREAERVLKEAETIRRENRDGGTFTTPAGRNLENRTNSEVDRLRNSFGNDREVQESRERLERLRQERIRLDRDQQFSPRIVPGFIPAPYSPGYSEYENPGSSTVIERSPGSPSDRPTPNRQFGQSDREFNLPRPDLGTASVSVGFNNGRVSPAAGYRFGNIPIGIEIGAVFNQDSLPPGTLNDFSVPPSLLQQFPNGFENLGRRNLTPQIGADLLGYLQVAPNVSLYGGVGVYFQRQANITRSNVPPLPNVPPDLFQQTSNVDVSVAFSGGADVKVGSSLRVGAGYHSLRGISARVGLDF